MQTYPANLITVVLSVKGLVCHHLLIRTVYSLELDVLWAYRGYLSVAKFMLYFVNPWPDVIKFSQVVATYINRLWEELEILYKTIGCIQIFLTFSKYMGHILLLEIRFKYLVIYLPECD